MSLKDLLVASIENAPVTTLENLVQLAPQDGLFLEFGVWQGHTINRISNTTENIVYGFDSFEGLPAKWHIYKKGDFACEIPENLRDNVYLIIGWFDETLPWFVEKHTEKVSFIHIDCNLYKSTKTVFDNLKHKINNECIIVFDDLYNYPRWEDHEFKAFYEFLKNTGYRWECVGKYSLHQAGFKIYV
jgi:hypothetical protein